MKDEEVAKKEATGSRKDTNPKDAVGVRKAGLSAVPSPVLYEIGLAMLEGARKYGRHNYRVAGVRASVYVDAAKAHIDRWWEGQDIDPDSGLDHVIKALACLVILRDASNQGMLTDDRPPKSPDGWREELDKKAAAIIDMYPDAADPCTQEGQTEPDLWTSVPVSSAQDLRVPDIPPAPKAPTIYPKGFPDAWIGEGYFWQELGDGLFARLAEDEDLEVHDSRRDSAWTYWWMPYASEWVAHSRPRKMGDRFAQLTWESLMRAKYGDSWTAD